MKQFLRCLAISAQYRKYDGQTERQTDGLTFVQRATYYSGEIGYTCMTMMVDLVLSFVFSRPY